MSEKNTVRYRADNLPEGRTDWARLEAMTDEEIRVHPTSNPQAPGHLLVTAA
jgi:hypothetical protein